jgi:protoporphyrinogen/coproporphyrinogen III oxidase
MPNFSNRIPGRADAGKVAIVGGGISGLAAAYELALQGADFTLFEASARLGGIIETVRTQGFVIECGPDSWVTEKPWARDLVMELGLGDQITPSNDQWRATYLLKDRRLIPLPNGMRMMVPTDLNALGRSHLFSAEALLAYQEEPRRAVELKASAPKEDESVASFVRRHFGGEVAETVAAPLLSGVFGGDIHTLSARAVMPAFVKMEAEHGSLITALQQKQKSAEGQRDQAIFSSLAGGMEMLVDGIADRMPAGVVRLLEPVSAIHTDVGGWRVTTPGDEYRFRSLVLATPAHVTRKLLASLGPEGRQMSDLLPRLSSSAIVVALAFGAAQAASMPLPRGFGFLVPGAPKASAGEHTLLACTFVDQKFRLRAPEGAILLRAFFGTEAAAALQSESDAALTQLAREHLGPVVARSSGGLLPEHVAAVVRRLPESLPQYEVGHLERIAKLESLARAWPRLHLAGSSYHGVGVSDLIREGRAAARAILSA